MRKTSRDEDPLLSYVRRGMARHGLRRFIYPIAAVLVIFLLYRWTSRENPTPSDVYGYKGEVKLMTPVKPEEPKLNTVKLDLYMESQCPDTSRFVHKQLIKAWEMLGSTNRVDLSIIPFGKARCIEKGDDFECSCQHGANECVLNQLMNCVIDRLGFPDKIVPVIDCIQGKRSLNDAMSQCIDNSPVLDSNQMRQCADGPRGRRLLALAGSRTVGLKPAMNFVPWIVINGERNADALYDLAENLCNALEPAPEACSVYEKKDDNSA